LWKKIGTIGSICSVLGFIGWLVRPGGSGDTSVSISADHGAVVQAPVNSPNAVVQNMAGSPGGLQIAGDFVVASTNPSPHESAQKFYELQRKEVFSQPDLHHRVQAYWISWLSPPVSVVYFALTNHPIAQSVEITTHDGDVSPASFQVFHNVVALQTRRTPILRQEGRFYCIKYTRDVTATNVMLTVSTMKFKLDDEEPPLRWAWFYPSKPNKKIEANENRANLNE